MAKVRQWTRPNAFNAAVTQKDFKLVEENLPKELQPGG